MIGMDTPLEELQQSLKTSHDEPVVMGISGKPIFLLSPEKTDYSLDDILRTLANTPRWGGRTKYPWSVLQHSALVQHLVEMYDGHTTDQLWATVHDFSEAFLGDVPTPLKRVLGDSYDHLERRWMRDICYRAGLCAHPVGAFPVLPAIVKKADLVALHIERAVLMEPSDATWPAQAIDPDLRGTVDIVNLCAQRPAEDAVDIFLHSYLMRGGREF